MEKMIIIGGTGGIGKQLIPMFDSKYEVISVGSSDVDVTNMDAVQAFFDLHSDVRIVLNLSGVSYNKFLHKYGSDYDNLMNQIDVNIKGVTNVIVACLPNMRANGYGRILLMSSVLSEMPVMGAGIYSACKGYIDTLTKSVSLENGFKGITCNSIQLGYFDAGLLYTIPEDDRENIKKTISLNRWGTIDELRGLIQLLIDTEYITGTNQKINGGIRY